ncbi:MAG TPA: hypothetical protein PKE45_06655 [Caldilineaceae bacterium]|nr:hypothetical protein [Caldilineaceae bacterium]
MKQIDRMDDLTMKTEPENTVLPIHFEDRSGAEFELITGGKVSATMKERIKTYSNSRGIINVQVWSGVEFEEKLRKDAPSLVRSPHRFGSGRAKCP